MRVTILIYIHKTRISLVDLCPKNKGIVIPSILEDLGLSAALEWVIDNVIKHDNIDSSVNIEKIDYVFSKEDLPPCGLPPAAVALRGVTPFVDFFEIISEFRRSWGIAAGAEIVVGCADRVLLVGAQR